MLQLQIVMTLNNPNMCIRFNDVICDAVIAQSSASKCGCFNMS